MKSHLALSVANSCPRWVHIYNSKPYTIIKSLSFQTRMKTHMTIFHTEDHAKPFQCKICSKGFATKLAFQEHTNTHTGEKPYQCEICEKRFASSGNMYMHRKDFFLFQNQTWSLILCFVFCLQDEAHITDTKELSDDHSFMNNSNVSSNWSLTVWVRIFSATRSKMMLSILRFNFWTVFSPYSALEKENVISVAKLK